MNGSYEVKEEERGIQAEGPARAKAESRQCMTQVLKKICFWSPRW